MKNILTIVVAFFIMQTSLFAQGWVNTYYDYSSNWLNSFGEKTLDNGYVMVGYTGIFDRDIHVKKTDSFGNVQWSYTLALNGNEQAVAIKQIPSTGGYVVLYHGSQTQFDPHLLRLDALGQPVYNQIVNVGMPVYTGSSNADMIITSDEHLLITSGTTDTIINPSPTLGLAKLDLSGNVLWSKFYNHTANYQTRPMTLTEAADGTYLLVGTIDTFYFNNGNGTDLYLIKTDTSGNDLWRKIEATPNHVSPHSVFHTSDGGYLITGTKRLIGPGGGSLLAVKLDANADEVWRWNASTNSTSDIAHGAVENADGTYMITGLADYGAPFYRQMALVKLSATGSLISNSPLSIGSAVAIGKQIYAGNNGGYSVFGADAQGTFILTTDSLGVLYSNHVIGNYYYDLNGNCLQDAGEPSVENRVIRAEKGAESRFGVTDVNGDYWLEIDTGTYTISAANLSPYWQFCQNPQTVTFTNFYSQDTIDFALQILDTCTYMEVDVSTPFLRRCFPSTYYINYDNLGTKAAQNSYVELTLDPYLTFDSSSIPMVLQTGNVYRFDIGTVPIMSRGTFAVHVTVDCDSTVLGQTHCVEAHIYPDTICIPNYWNGPIIRTSSTCANDSVIFLLENIGANMSAPQDYSIIEEHVMIQITPFQLGSGANQFITVPAAPGAIYRMEAAQAAGFPPLLGDSIAISNYVGCNTPPTINFPGLLGQFYNGNSSPAIAVDCRENIGSYDPNDKQAQPLGYGVQHYINNNIPLNYHIRFQNTGTDTAFTVVVVDTIDADLDAASIRMGASSHNYTWELRENGILVVTFDNIMLPDSNVNERASNGFFKFEIQQEVNNPVGTMITNQAGIYFDFNPPVMTNQTFHTIGQDFIDVLITGTENVLDDAIDIQVFPNPFKDFTTLQVNGKNYGTLELEVLNVTGQLVETIQVQNSNRIILNRNQLVQGAYFYRLKGDQQLLNTGKLIVR